MKSFLRYEPVVWVIGLLIWIWMVTLQATVRWRVEGEEAASAAWTGSERGGIIACWHRDILLLPSGYKRNIEKWPGRSINNALIVSMSADGHAVAKAIHRLGLDIIRGSSANKKKADKDKRGIQAAIEGIRRLRQNGGVIVTLDGPRGPAEVASPGCIMMAQKTGAVIVPYAVAASPVKHANSWDRMVLPPPFARGAIVFGPPMTAPTDADPEALRQELQRRMDDANRRAQDIVRPASQAGG